jgi:hypothetical protein
MTDKQRLLGLFDEKFDEVQERFARVSAMINAFQIAEARGDPRCFTPEA